MYSKHIISEVITSGSLVNGKKYIQLEYIDSCTDPKEAMEEIKNLKSKNPDKQYNLISIF